MRFSSLNAGTMMESFMESRSCRSLVFDACDSRRFGGRVQVAANTICAKPSHIFANRQQLDASWSELNWSEGFRLIVIGGQFGAHGLVHGSAAGGRGKAEKWR